MSIQKITSIFFSYILLHDDKRQNEKFICIPHTEMHADKGRQNTKCGMTVI